MSLRTIAAALVVLAALAASPARAATAVVKTDEVRAELMANAPEGIAPGRTIWLGLQLEHQPHWHTYWKNPGDSGLPTTLSWQLPPGVSAGEIAWPTPSRLPVGPLMNYGYEGRVLLPVPVTVGPDFAASTLPVRLSAQWLVCKDVCIPQQGDFELSLPTQAATAGNAAAFEAARAAAPRALGEARATAALADDGRLLRITVDPGPSDWKGRAVDVFVETAGVVDHAAPVRTRWEGARWLADVPLSAQRLESPARMDAVLRDAGAKAGVRIGFDITGAWPALSASPVPSPPSPSPAAAPGAAQRASGAGLGIALWFALIGGALLNLMPCVFPILSLKVLGFAGHAHSRRALAAGGLAYTTGVVLSFVVLAGLLIALRAGGEQIGWGFQLQSPYFVALLAVLFSVIALNLAGLFEFGTLLPSGAAGLRLRHPLADSFLTGVLAVAVASPCTAPFMGAALGMAFVLPAWQALALFATLGLGMALPYLVLCLWPTLARAMPRPGAWMATFKTVMAFPMLATVVWLVWVLGQQTGIDGAAALLALLLAVTFALWAWGRVDSAPPVRRAWSAAGLLLLGATLAWAWPSWREAPGPTPAHADGRWQPWSGERVAALNAEGRTVFVDFTAAWCVTCQVNKRTTLNDAGLLADFEAQRVALLRADWTRRDAAISAELTRLGRNGVPVYAIYRPGETQPLLLPEVLTAQAVRDALAAAPN